MKYSTLFAVLLCFLMVNTNDAFSQDEGTLTKRNVTHYGCEINYITAKWSFSTLMGEAIKSGSYKWEAGYGTDDDCLSYKDFIILKVESNYGHAWVDIDPTVPKAGQGYAYNVSGSPSWDEFFCAFNRNGEQSDCFSEENAKTFWKNGFRVVDFALRRYHR